MAVVNPDDLQRWWRVAQAVDNPVGLAGTMLGLDEAEQRAGIPAWAWIVAGVSVGIVVGASRLGRPLQRIMESE